MKMMLASFAVMRATRAMTAPAAPMKSARAARLIAPQARHRGAAAS
jgi:hypothetical protein